MTRRTRQRLLAAFAVLVVAGALLWISMGTMGDNLVYYLSPTELLAKGATAVDTPVRLGGQVAPGSVVWKAETQDLLFEVTDGARKVRVSSKGTPPQMFQDAMGVVVEGTYDSSGVFRARNLMVKHSNEYRPPHEGEDPQKVYQSLIKEQTL